MKTYTKEEYIAVAVEYFGDAFAELGLLCVEANKKHNFGQKVHWSRGKSNKHELSLKHHLGIPEDTDLSHMLEVDEEFGNVHAVNAFWRIGAMNQIRVEKKKL